MSQGEMEKLARALREAELSRDAGAHVGGAYIEANERIERLRIAFNTLVADEMARGAVNPIATSKEGAWMSDPREADVDIDDRPDAEPGTPAGEDAPIGIRIGQDPSNLGDEIPEVGDVTFPEPVGETPSI